MEPIKEVERCKTCFTIRGSLKGISREIVTLKRFGHIHFETKWESKGQWIARISTKRYPNATIFNRNNSCQ